MELKPYQKQTLADLEEYIDHLKTMSPIQAWRQFWQARGVTPTRGLKIQPWNSIPHLDDVASVCLKVPTGGGKTFIAVNAVKTIFSSAFQGRQHKLVVWLCPSDAILSQTLRTLSDPTHPYRLQLDRDFNSRVVVLDKDAALNGRDFTPGSLRENLTILLLTLQSLRVREDSKEGRRVYRDNGYLMAFRAPGMPEEADISLMKVLRDERPVVVIDESHHSKTKLSAEMLECLAPSFVLELTATPRDESNVVSFVNALELQKNDMVKLPVIVQNYSEPNDVIRNAIHLQRKLERDALEEKRLSGEYIRPIVLFQAEANLKSRDEKTTYSALKQKLVEAKIPEEQIRIKTANIDELKGIDLMNPDCPVRFVITVNALGEGWDCPFAYVLATIANRSSAVQVEQILGRILRLPNTRQKNRPMLGVSFVLTSSQKFRQAVDNIVEGLRSAGFSDRDYRLATKTPELTPLPAPVDAAKPDLDDLADIDPQVIARKLCEAVDDGEISNLEQAAASARRDNERALQEYQMNQTAGIPTELADQTDFAQVQSRFRDVLSGLKIPQFYLSEKNLNLFARGGWVKLEKNNLLDASFILSRCACDIDFSDLDTETRRIDLNEDTGTPLIRKIQEEGLNQLRAYLAGIPARERRIDHLARNAVACIGKLPPHHEMEILKYIQNVFRDFTDVQIDHYLEHQEAYLERIKKRIEMESTKYRRERFFGLLDTNKIELQDGWAFPERIQVSREGPAIEKSLYTKENPFNDFERRVIEDVANLPNILFWTRNVEKRGYAINGFINHYPDFIVVTKNRTIVLLEIKGDHLDAEDKIELGEAFSKGGRRDVKYCLVYEDREVKGALTRAEFMSRIREW